jgi:hypothetical protein
MVTTQIKTVNSATSDLSALEIFNLHVKEIREKEASAMCWYDQTAESLNILGWMDCYDPNQSNFYMGWSNCQGDR